MTKLPRPRLLDAKGGLMISGMRRFGRSLTSLLLACVATTLGAPVRAQSSEDGWFDDGKAPPSTPAPAAPASPSAPAAPADAARAPLPQSPLLEQEGDDAAEDRDPRALTTWNPYVDQYGYWIDDSRYGRVWVPHS